MEQHPVPQNVTTFQFRLIGDMTIKQFGYLACGIILGYIFYKLPLPFFFTWPLGIGSAVLGFGLAFVPVEERPMDVWIASFFKNVYSPTQYIWQKKSPTPTKIAPPVPQKTPGQTTATAGPAPNNAHIQQSIPTRLAKLISSWFGSTHPDSSAPKPEIPRAPAAAAPPRHHAPTLPVVPVRTAPPGVIISLKHMSDPFAWFKKLFHSRPKVELSPGLTFNNALAPHQVPIVQPQPLVAPPQPVAVPAIQSVTPPQPAAGHQTDKLQGQLSDSLVQREQLEKELVALRQQMEQQARSPATPSPMRRASLSPTTSGATSVHVFTQEAATRAGIPRLTTFPNIVTGIIKDHNGNLLPGMLITVRDGNDTPLRALKTNKLGQFAASTPLPNGTYLVEIEDPKNVLVFDKVQIPLSGAVAPPIEVVAKSQQRMERDRLAKEIFGQNQI